MDSHGTLLPILICLLLQAQVSHQQSCFDICILDQETSMTSWESELRASGITARSVRLTWSVDLFASASPAEYIIAFRTTNTITLSETSVITDTTHDLTGLEPNTIYEVSVCRAVENNTRNDNCGGCRLCVTTEAAEEPPSEPRSVIAATTGPETIVIEWLTPAIVNEGGISNYTVTCTPGDLMQTLDALKATFFRLSPNTTYSCSVVATNNFGSSSPVTLNITTPPRTTTPGVLLVFTDNTVYYRPLPITAGSVTEFPFFTTTDAIIGMDYNYQQSVLYLTANDSNSRAYLKKFTFNASINSNGRIVLTPKSEGQVPVTIVTASEGVVLDRISVDWVYNEIYYVEILAPTVNRIKRLSLHDNGSINFDYCVAEFTDKITDIAVEPVHGYFYWSTRNNLFRVGLSAMRTSGETCPVALPMLPDTLVSTSILNSFTIEQDEALYFFGSFSCSTSNTNVTAALSTSLSGLDQPFYNFAIQQDVQHVESFTKLFIVASEGTVGYLETDGATSCPNTAGGGVTIENYPFPVQAIRMYRDSQQPLPVPPSPPTSIRVMTTDTSATFTWEAPEFVADFFSSDAFDDWTYTVVVCSDTSTACVDYSTTGLSLTLSNLQADMIYYADITASGPDPQQGRSTPQQLVFSTKFDDFDETEMLLSTEMSVQQLMLNGEGGVMNIGGQFSTESNAVAYDSYTDSLFWSIEGGQASIFSNELDTDVLEEATTLYSFRDQPFALEFDWVGRRLFWIEDGEESGDSRREVVASVVNPELDPVPTNDVSGVQSTTLDAQSGVLFWTDRSSINMETLSGISLGVCYAPEGPVQVSSLAVDAVRKRLYWLSGQGEPLTINQMEYDSVSCNNDVISSHDLSEVSFSSTSTILVYGSNTLFISNRGADEIYTVPSDLSSVGSGQTLATGVITGLEGIRDIVIGSTSLQPLPDDYQSDMRYLRLLEPPVIPSAPFLGAGSTTNTIIIEWPAAPFGRTVFYRVTYSLERTTESNIITGTETTRSTSITLEDQQANTMVSVNVTTLSLWTMAEDAITSGSFISLPDIPGQVMNVRAFSFRPTTNASLVTGIVFWDKVEYAQGYMVTVSSSGTVLDDVLQSEFDDTSYVILRTDDFGTISYLTEGITYDIQVVAMNQAGEGEASTTISFTTDSGSSFPQQVLSVGTNASGSDILGSMADELNQDLSISEPGPVVVDAIGRTAYWYSQSDSRIYSQSLHSGSIQPFLSIPDDEVVLGMAFDWIGKFIYMLRMDTATRSLKVYNLLIYDTDRVYNVFPSLVETAPEGSTYQLLMNPFTGFLYWTETASGSTGTTSLHQLDLRDSDSTSTTLLSATQARRRRRKRRSYRLKRQSNLDVVTSLTSALAQDPTTAELLVCNSASGNILRCNPTDLTCAILVERNSLVLPTGQVSDGLPATSLAWNEERLYWANADTPGVYAVDLSAPTVLIVVSTTASVSSIVTLSPGQQTIPSNQTCLSPMFGNVRPNIVDTATMITNSSVLLEWEVTNLLPESCSEFVFSISPYIYIVEYELYQGTPLFEEFTRRTCFNFTDLLPYREYTFNIFVQNQFTMLRFPGDRFDVNERVFTAEGVPFRPTGLTAEVEGTASITVKWDIPTQDALLGNLANTTYIVIFENGSMTTNVPQLNVTDSSFLIQGERNLIQLVTNNGALNSTPASINVALWGLVPAATVENRTKTSLIVRIAIEDDTRFENIQRVAIMACNTSLVTGQPCTCPGIDTTSLNDDDYFPVGNRPFNMTFDLSGLVTFTNYCVQSFGDYGTEMTPGIGQVQVTASGVPGAPFVTRNLSILTWTEPSGNGEVISGYTLTLSQPTTDLPTIVFDDIRDRSFELENSRVELDTLYRITVVALNVNGRGPESNPIEYTRTDTSTGSLSLPDIAGIAVGGAALLAILAIIIIIICFLRCRPSKHELRSLSYMYGPDHELSNLRDAYRNAQSSNPHYTWSREDYICTDEQLSLLNKFPRSNLKLENYIDSGEFGEVFQGTATDILGPATGPTPVAVKTLHKGSSEEEQAKFLSEAALMANFNHPNIVKVLGVCVDNDPVYIIMELMPGGDLLKFLREAKMDHGPTLLTLTEQIQVAVDVATGCNYLEQQHFIHRDIAARNCLVSSKGSDRVVKIGDFGLAKDLYSSDYYQVEGQRKLPVRWMAPEALLQGKFTVESDIWSFGVLLWEIMALGNQPYPGRINQEVLQFVTGGGRLDRPDKCPSKIYHLMQNCWKRYTSDRPHFDTILNVLTGYLDRLKRPDSVYYSDSETDEEGEGGNIQRQGSGKLPSRTPSFSVREGIINLARSGSMKLRNSFRRHNSVHKREEHTTSQEDNGSAFRERGPF